MSYIFKHWLDEHVTKLRDEHWPTNKEAWNESSQSYRGLSSVQNPRCSSCPKCPERSPPRHRWLVLGRWDGASCRVCVCFSWACGLERRAKEQLGSEDAQRTCWSPVSLGCSHKSSRRA